MTPVTITFRANREGITMEELNEFEASLEGLILPEDYKQHMLTYNGGVVVEDEIEHKSLYGNYGGGAISDFASIKYGGNTLEELNNALSDRLPSGYIAIGYTAGGGVIIMSLNNDNTYGNTKIRITDGDIIDLSPSFTDLLNDMVEIDY